jgi:maltose O-acetyltransferase
MLERMRAGELYLADDPEIAAMSRRAMELTAEYHATGPHDGERRRRLLGRLLGSVGDGVEIRPPFQVDYGVHLTVGHRVFANFGLVALDVATVEIGDDVQIGPNVQLLTPTHPLDARLRLDKWEAGEPIRIGRNVWIGGGAIVLPGVSVGEHTVVGAGAVVTRDLPDRVVAVGNPARIIREVDVPVS